MANRGSRLSSAFPVIAEEDELGGRESSQILGFLLETGFNLFFFLKEGGT